MENHAFRGSRRGRNLLHYLVDNAIEGKFDHLKERIIGIEVFGRSADYDTAADAVVRVTANDLRKRLAQAYAEADPKNPVRMELPVGSYIPEFHFPPEPAPPLRPDLRLLPVAGKRQRFTGGLLTGFLLILVICLLSNIWWWRQNVALARNGWIAADSDFPQTLPWSALMSQPERPIYVVLADASMGGSQDFPGRKDLALAGMMSEQAQRLAVDATLASHLLKLHPMLNRRTTVLFAGDVRFEELNDSNAILIGTGGANRWTQLLQPQMNFSIQFDPDTGRFVCLNRSPATGEPERYVASGSPGANGVAYAIFALTPNPRENGHVLLLAGTSAEGTREAGDFVMDRERFGEALRQAGIDPSGPVRHFEMLLKLNVVGGNSYHSEIVGHRLIPPGNS